MGLYINREDVRVRLIGKVRFTEDEDEENKMSMRLLDRLINLPDSRWSGVFQTPDSSDERDPPDPMRAEGCHPSIGDGLRSRDRSRRSQVRREYLVPIPEDARQAHGEEEGRLGMAISPPPRTRFQLYEYRGRRWIRRDGPLDFLRTWRLCVRKDERPIPKLVARRLSGRG